MPGTRLQILRLCTKEEKKGRQLYAASTGGNRTLVKDVFLSTRRQESERRETLRRKNKCYTDTRKIHKQSTGTDGHRVRCHQFYTSSKSWHLPFLASSRSSFHKKVESLLTLSHSAGQGRKIFPTAYQKISGRLCLRVSMKITSPPARSQPIMASRMKPFVVSYAPAKRRIGGGLLDVTAYFLYNRA